MNGTNGNQYEPLKLSLHRKRWQYRGEGNANLVLALTEERKIVRFRKAPLGATCADRVDEAAAASAHDAAERERVWREARFCRGIMAPLLGHCYVQPPTTAFVEPAELQRIERLLSGKRPAHRHHKGLRLGFAMIYPDYALLPAGLEPSGNRPSFAPTFCVELKPKQGWLPPTDRRLPKCTYCLTQFLKLRSGLIQARSQYCPLDLFSGCRERMLVAIHALLFDPQNNLKIFQDGVLVYGEGEGEEGGRNLNAVLKAWFPEEGANRPTAEDKLCCLVLEASSRQLGRLEKVQWAEPKSTGEGDGEEWAGERLPATLLAQATAALAEEVPCDWDAVPLPTDCILARILDIQKLEVNGADRVYRSYRGQTSVTPRDEYSYVDTVLKTRSLTGMQRYLLATTAKDCSVMMTFQRMLPPRSAGPPPEPWHIVRDLDSVCYVMNVGVSDVDPKPMSCIEKHRHRDHETLIACLDLH